MQILGIAGSLREGSHNRRLLDASQAELPAEANLEIFSGLGAIPAFNEDVAAPLSDQKVMLGLSTTGSG